MKITRFIFGLSLLSFYAVVTSCSDDDSTAPIETPQDLVAVDGALSSNNSAYVGSLQQSFTFNTADADESNRILLTSKDNVTMNIQTDKIRNEGTVLTGEFTLNYVEIFDPVDMILAGIPTVTTKDQEGNSSLLVSGGEFNIKFAEKDGKTVNGDISLYIPSALTGIQSFEMASWQGIYEDSVFGWSQDPPLTDGLGSWVDTLSDFGYDNLYYYSITDLNGMAGTNWFNCDRFYGNDNLVLPKLTTPIEYTPSNSATYFMLKDEASLGYFPMQLPTGLKGYVIFVSANANKDYIYAIKEVTVSADLDVAFTESDMKVANLEEFKKQLKLL